MEGGASRMEWQREIESLWMDFLFWVRYYIFSLMLQRRDISYVAVRTLRNATDFADALSAYYGQEAAKRLEEYMTQHLLLLAQIAAIVSTGQDDSPMKEAWYQNAEDIAGFFAEVNPYWEKAYWLRLLRYRYDMEENLIELLHEQKYEESVTQYDLAFGNARELMEYMVYGIARQFQLQSSY